MEDKRSVLQLDITLLCFCELSFVSVQIATQTVSTPLFKFNFMLIMNDQLKIVLLTPHQNYWRLSLTPSTSLWCGLASRWQTRTKPVYGVLIPGYITQFILGWEVVRFCYALSYKEPKQMIHLNHEIKSSQDVLWIFVWY